jgi:hypothetical protein
MLVACSAPATGVGPPKVKKEPDELAGLTTMRAGVPMDPQDPPAGWMWIGDGWGCARIDESEQIACWGTGYPAADGVAAANSPGLPGLPCGPLCARLVPRLKSTDLSGRSSTRDGGCSAQRIRRENLTFRLSCTGALPTPDVEDIAFVRQGSENPASGCGYRLRDASIWCWGAAGSAYAALSPSSSEGRAKAVRVRFAQSPNPDAAMIDFSTNYHPVPSDVDKTAGDPDRFHAAVESSWGPLCLLHRTCASSTTALPRCEASLRATTWSELSPTAGAMVGQTVTVRGALRVSPQVTCTAVLCGALRPCCNDCFARFVLESEGAKNPLWVDSFFTGRWSCTGDDSRLCCEHPAVGQTIIAVGVLEAYPRWCTGHCLYSLREPALCEVAP